MVGILLNFFIDSGFFWCACIICKWSNQKNQQSFLAADQFIFIGQVLLDKYYLNTTNCMTNVISNRIFFDDSWQFIGEFLELLQMLPFSFHSEAISSTVAKVGKNMYFANVKSFCHLMWNTFCHLGILWQCLSLRFDRKWQIKKSM